MREQNWWDDRTMPNADGPDWHRDAEGLLWAIDPRTGGRSLVTETGTPPRPVCAAAHDDSPARCHLEPNDHGPNHQGWSHYPGQLAVWPVEHQSGNGQ